MMQNVLPLSFFKPGDCLNRKPVYISFRVTGFHTPPGNSHSTCEINHLTYCKEQSIEQQQHSMDNASGVLKIHASKAVIEKF